MSLVRDDRCAVLVTVGVAGFVNVGLLGLLKSILVEVDGPLLRNAWIAALTEPITTKLLWGLVPVGWFAYVVDHRCIDLARYRLLVGSGGGLVMGVTELYIKAWVFAPDDFSLLVWRSAGFDPAMLSTLALHTFNGLVVVGTLLTVADGRLRYRDVVAVVAALLVAGGIHWAWNTWLVAL
jgi:hypothetical protein